MGSEIRSEPCSACPYRKDVPSGVWAATEYEKLVDYDNETFAQPTAVFACHATPDHLCHGWAVVGGWELLALRLRSARSGSFEIPEPTVELFATHGEAALHGMQQIEDPSSEARVTIDRLLRKYPRIRGER